MCESKTSQNQLANQLSSDRDDRRIKETNSLKTNKFLELVIDREEMSIMAIQWTKRTLLHDPV